MCACNVKPELYLGETSIPVQIPKDNDKMIKEVKKTEDGYDILTDKNTYSVTSDTTGNKLNNQVGSKYVKTLPKKMMIQCDDIIHPLIKMDLIKALNHIVKHITRSEYTKQGFNHFLEQIRYLDECGSFIYRFHDHEKVDVIYYTYLLNYFDVEHLVTKLESGYFISVYEDDYNFLLANLDIDKPWPYILGYKVDGLFSNIHQEALSSIAKSLSDLLAELKENEQYGFEVISRLDLAWRLVPDKEINYTFTLPLHPHPIVNYYIMKVFMLESCDDAELTKIEISEINDEFIVHLTSRYPEDTLMHIQNVIWKKMTELSPILGVNIHV